MSAIEVLQRVYGYSEFRGEQAAIVDAAIAGQDVLVLMPTGGGKSVCYQIPSLVRDGVGVVISPLIALMADQVAALRQLGVRAAYLNSTLDYREAAEVEAQVRAGHLDLLYLAPERLLMPRTLELLAEAKLALFAIDEAHCVSQWGHDFRPEYLGLSELAERFPGVPRMALTATADVPTRDEIVQRLALHDPRRFVASFDRPNIRYRVSERANAKQQLLRFLQKEHPGEAGVVYCLSRKKVEATAEWLQGNGFDAVPYHAGLGAEKRAAHQDRFLREDGVIVVATIAFGMGIDKPDVRFVVHLDLPGSVEAYYQETGRAGRDGEPADAWMLYGLGDVVQRRQMIDSGEAEDGRKRIERSKLDAMLGYCELDTCRRQPLLRYFGEVLEQPCGNCDNCLWPPDTDDATEPARQALSAVYRTGQRFGVSYLVDHLLGKRDERATRFGHDSLSTFGIGQALSADRWRRLFRQLIARGYLDVDVGGFGGLHLTEAARGLLKGEETVRVRRKAAAPSGGGRRSSAPQAALAPGDEALFERLRGWRKDEADEQGVPAYVVFHDSTLRDIAREKPADDAALGAISGVSAKRLERYGAAILELVAGAS
ncbi:DNA helicase RecQ [uncultured Abyssibacter sp.]|uniref:DNA helicase RecQ n=1 Tax=uncultured Abyssibacter sp. TaxID=2320202 RepID=UPI0032B28720